MGQKAERATKKSQETRERIVDAALTLFREHGFEKTTMRAIAAEAGMSLGSAYYYFRSKDALIQGFYDQVQADHRAAAAEILETERSFEKRLSRVLLAWHEVAAPYHGFAGVLFRTAADPDSPLNPFSEESAPAREASTDILRDVIRGAREKFPADLDEDLPQLLWLFHMSMVLYWVHDRSDDLAKSRRLIERGSAMVAKFLKLVKLPPMKPLRTLALKTYRELAE